jgi:hypothetical protein
VQRERTPQVYLVRPGVHRVRITGGAFDELRVVEATAPGADVMVRVVAPAHDAAEQEEKESAGAARWFAGAGVALVPYHFFGTPTTPEATRFADQTNVTLGVTLEAGVSIVERFYLTGDLFGAVGTYGHPNFVVGGGVGLSYRFDFGLWARAAATIADVDNAKDGRHLSTDVVLGPSVELAYEIARTPRFTWLVAAGACYLPADALRDNDALFVPIRIGLRSR